MSTDLETNLQIIEEFTQRLQVAVIGAEETTDKHVEWVEGPVDGVIQTANGPLKTLRGQIAEWRLAADQDVASAIEGYDTQFAAALAQFHVEFDAYLITVGFEPAVEYAAGILIERRSQTVVIGGVTYYWTATLPHTTTGDFGTEMSWQIAPIVGGIEAPSFTFAGGGKLLRKTQSVMGLDGEWYYWTGTFPKIVPPASTLESAGGVGQNLFKTASGYQPLRPTLKLVVTSMGLTLNSGSFEAGATITERGDLLVQYLTGKVYRWNGTLPKVVDLFSTPGSSGGISPVGWEEIQISYNHKLGFESLRRSYAETGLTLVDGSFEAGGTVNSPTEVLLYENTGIPYKWTGTIPEGGKVVPPMSTPTPSGPGGWNGVEDAALRAQLADAEGAKNVLSSVATAYGIPFNKLKVWAAGIESDLTEYWYHDNKIWQSNSFPHTLETSPSFLTAHIVPVDGKLYPDHFGATYIPGTDQTPAIARCEAWQWRQGYNQPLYLRAVIHDLITQLQITRAPLIIGDGGGYDSLRNQKISSGRIPRGAVLHGKVVGDFSVKIKPSQYWFGGYVENVTVVGRVDPLASKTAGSGVLMDEFGWSAKITGLTIEDFTGSGLSIGYLQDTTFDRLTILGCGDAASAPALKFTRNSNFLYFNDSHIEDGNYLLSSEGDANGSAWEIHWKGAHFEVGNYTGTPDPSLEHRYATPCISFVGFHRQWYWNECTHVPVGASFLQVANGGTVDSQPYYMQGDQVAGFKFTDCNFNRATTGCDFINLASPSQALIREFGVNEFIGTKFNGANPTKAAGPVKLDDGRIVGGGIDFWVGYNSSQLNGYNVSRGIIDKVGFTSTGDAVNKTGGKLIQSSISTGLTVGECEYDLSKEPYIWVSKECCLSDRRSKQIKNISVSTTLNMELEKPGTTYQFTAVVTVNDIINCQRGRNIRFFNTSGAGCSFAQTPTLYPNGAVALTINHLVGAEFVSDPAGIVIRY